MSALKKYWYVYVLSWKLLLEYRFDNALRGFRYTVSVLLFGTVWVTIAKISPSAQFEPQYVVTYFIYSALFFGLANYHLDEIETEIRLGYISKFLVKPIDAFWYYFAHQAAIMSFDVLTKLIFIWPIAYFFSIELTTSLPNLVMGLLFIPFIALTTFSFYFAATTCAFWFNEVSALRLTLVFIQRFLSGAFIPLTLFSPLLTSINSWLPFPYFVGTPIAVLLNQLSMFQIIQALAILFIWTVLGILSQRWLWHKATHSFEATGL